MGKFAGKSGKRRGLKRSRAASAEIVARQRAVRRAGPVTVRFVCPRCGGPHSRAEH